MYIYSAQNLGETWKPTAVLDREKAVSKNFYWSQKLGWSKHLGSIMQLVGYTPFPYPDLKKFAEAIARWQSSQGLLADGIIGPKTWRRVQDLLLVNQGATTSVSSVVPKLVKKIETSPAFYTMYVDIDLNPVWESRKIDGKWRQIRSYATPMTGIFIPKTYVPQSTVNLILYLHGFKVPCGLEEKTTIDQYWSQGFFKRLREDVNDSGKNVILVAPTLGPRSGAGKLIKAGGFNAFLDQVLAALNAYNPLKKIPFINRFTKIKSIGNIILACHSGGGTPMLAIANLNSSTDSYVTHIKECWGFDCLYNRNDAKEWIKWAKTYPRSQLFIYYRDKNSSGTKKQSELLKSQKLRNVCVQCTKTRHCLIPSQYWKERLQQVPCNINPC